MIRLMAGLLVFAVTGFMAQIAGAADVEMYDDLTVNGTVMADYFSGNGSGLTDLPLAYQLPKNCLGNQVPKWNGTAWGCGNDNNSGGTVTGIYGGSGTSVAPGMTSTEYIISVATGGITSNKLAANSVNASHVAFYGKVAIVAATGGEFANPLIAMINVSSWCGTPSATNPCLVKIMPGVYDIGTSSVTMQPYIDIEGSGENVTVISGSIDSATAGVVKGADHAELRFLTVNNSGTGHANAIAIYNYHAHTGKITNVIATASSGSNSYGVFNDSSNPTMMNVNATASYGSNNFGVYNLGYTPVMTNVTVNAWGGTNSYGIYNDGYSAPIMDNVNVTASSGTSNSYGIYNFASSPAITNSTILAHPGMGAGSAYGICNVGSSAPRIDHSRVNGTTSVLYNNTSSTFNVAYSRLEGGLPANGGTFRCVGAYSGNYGALGANCQ